LIPSSLPPFPQPISVAGIRAGRPKPGLAAQHLAGLRLASDLTGGALAGGALGSTEVELTPGPARPARGGWYAADARTAGACTLLAQAALPVCLFAAAPPGGGGGGGAVRLSLRGGTDADFAPPADFLRHVLAPALARSLTAAGAAPPAVAVPRRGFFPAGQGELELEVTPLPPGASLPALRLDRRGRVTALRVRAYAAGAAPAAHAQRMADAAAAGLRAAAAATAGGGDGGPLPEPEIEVEAGGAAAGAGVGVLLTAETEGGCVLSASARPGRGQPPEAAGAAAAAELAALIASGACVDEHLADQLIVFAALAEGTSRLLARAPLSLHARTAIAVARQLLPGVEFREAEAGGGGLCLLECTGVGWRAPAGE